MREYQRTRRLLAKTKEPISMQYDLARPPEEVFLEWAHDRLIVPFGPLQGKPFQIPEWQYLFIKDVLHHPSHESALSVARKNGKSGLIAALLLAHLCGPLNRQNWRGIATAINGRLAKELRETAYQTAMISGLGSWIVDRKSPIPGLLFGRNGSKVDFLSADRASGHGVGADLALIDEAGLLEERNRPLWNAIFSAISGRDGRFCSISIRGDGPMFAEQADREDEIAVHQYISDPEDDIHDPETWHKANPGIANGIKAYEYMRRQARRVETSPDNESDFRAFDLNQPLSPNKLMICQLNDWKKAQTTDLPPAQGPCTVGVDLGGSTSMTAAQAFWPKTGRAETWCAFPAEPDLRIRGLNDGVGRRYLTAEKNGELRTYPGLVTPVRPFLSDVFTELGARGVQVIAVGADRYRQAEAKEVFRDIQMPFNVFWRGHGQAGGGDMTHDIRSWQKAVKQGFFKHKRSTMLTAAIIGSSIEEKEGAVRLFKRKGKDRIDALSASIIATGLGELLSGFRSPSSAVVG